MTNNKRCSFKGFEPRVFQIYCYFSIATAITKFFSLV